MQNSSDQHEQLRIGRIAWATTMTTGLGAVAVSLTPPLWTAEAYEALRFATVFYGSVGAFYLLKSRVSALAARPVGPTSQLGQPRGARSTQLQHT